MSAFETAARLEREHVVEIHLLSLPHPNDWSRWWRADDPETGRILACEPTLHDLEAALRGAGEGN